MIGSTLSRMAMAEKLTIRQLENAIKAGTVPAYVGVPLLQQKVQDQKKAQMAMAGQASPQPSIAEQVMGEAQGIEGAESNLPTEGFAPGGIVDFDPDAVDGYAGGGMVAFAEGDLVDEEDDDSTPDELDKMLEALQAQNEAYADHAASQGIGAIGINPDRPSGVGIRPEAKAPSGIEALEARVLRQESGGRRYDKEGKLLTSSKGAEGEMQVMPMTQRDPGFGVTPARDNSPEEKARVGRDYLRALYKHYNGDEQLTLAAYNWGPGNVDKWLAGGRKGAVPAETRQYAGLAKGGIASIQRFDKGDLVQDDTVYDEITGMPLYGSATTKPGVGSIAELVQPGYKPFDPKEWEKQFGSKKEKEDWTKFDTATAEFEKEREAQIKQDEENAKLAEKAKENEVKAADEAKKAEAESPAAKMQKYLDDIRATINQQRQQDKNMALITAGLGIAGGTSKNALTNIGQGGIKGAEYLMGANKATAAQEAALTKGQLGAYNLAETQKWRQGQAAEAAANKAALALGPLRERTLKDIAAIKGKSLENISGVELQQLYKDVDSYLAKDAGYQKLYKQAYGYDFAPSTTAAAPVNYGQTYGLTPRKS